MATTTRFSARKSNLLIYFIAVYGMTWLLQALVLLARYHLISCAPWLVLLLFGTAGFGPTDAALVMIVCESGIAGIWALLRQAGRWYVNPIWYIIALLLPILFVLIPVRISVILGVKSPVHWLQMPQNIATVIVPSLGEEFGWRGFALPRLQRRYSALRASLILGMIWACWHLPVFFLPDAPLVALPIFFVAVIAESILLTWLYNSTGNSLLIIIVSHMALDLGLMNIPSVAIFGLLPPILAMLMYCAGAVAVLLISGPRTLCRNSGANMRIG